MKRLLSALALLLCLIMASCTALPSTPVDTEPSHNHNSDAPSPAPTPTPDEDGEEENTSPDSSCNHTFGDWMTTKEPSCAENGSQVRICSACSFAQTQNLDPLGHTTEAGTCERCGKSVGQDLAASIRDVIEIYDVYVTEVNSAGGVEIGAAFTNTSDKTIKYIRFYVVPYNAVGDQMYCEIQDHSRFEAYVTGPLEPGHEGYSRYGLTTSAGHYWENCWWNHEISTIELTGVKIEYMDGSEFTLDRDTVKLAMTDYPIVDEVDSTGFRTGISRNHTQNAFDFDLSLINRHSVSLKRQAKVDIRIVNADDELLFERTYRLDLNDYTQSWDDYLGDVYTASCTIYDHEIKAGSSSVGTIYYRVYSDDGEFSFEEESEMVTDLPEQEDHGSTWVDIVGQTYNGYNLAVISNDNCLFSLNNVYSETTHYTDDRLVITISGMKLSGNKTFSSKIPFELLDPNGRVVLSSTFDPWAYEAGDTFETSCYITDYVEGGYTLRFTNRLMNSEGLYINLNDDLSGCAVQLSPYVAADLVIPDSYAGIPVTSISYGGATNLPVRSVYIPATVSSITDNAFTGCDSLSSITVSAENPYLHSAGNCIIETETRTLIAGCKASVIPADGSVTIIGDCAFANCVGLTAITIPEGITELGFGVFQGCVNLTSVSLPHSLTDLGAYVFEGCTSLPEITIPAGVEAIPTAMFLDCTGLQTVNILGDVTYFHYICFSGCTSLKNFTIPATAESVAANAFLGCTSLLESENGLLYVGNWLVGFEEGIFDAVVREGTTHIANGAFYSAATLKTLTLPDSLQFIDDFAFEACYHLTTVTIGSGLNSLGYGAFSDCFRLTELTYAGTIAQWNALATDNGWLSAPITVHGTDGDAHYVPDEF